MFAYLRGSLEHIDENYIVVDVGGLGYKIFAPASTIQRLPHIHKEVKVFTHSHIREDAFDIYGFIDKEQLAMFELVISVSGVGPKVALGILSSIPPTDFALAVVSSDVKTITRAPGIGKKLAERIILELKDKIAAEELTAFGGTASFGVGGNGSYSSEAVDALVVLGYSAVEAAKAVQKVKTEGMELEQVIKLSLKSLIK